MFGNKYNLYIVTWKHYTLVVIETTIDNALGVFNKKYPACDLAQVDWSSSPIDHISPQLCELSFTATPPPGAPDFVKVNDPAK